MSKKIIQIPITWDFDKRKILGYAMIDATELPADLDWIEFGCGYHKASNGKDWLMEITIKPSHERAPRMKPITIEKIPYEVVKLGFYRTIEQAIKGKVLNAVHRILGTEFPIERRTEEIPSYKTMSDKIDQTIQELQRVKEVVEQARQFEHNASAEGAIIGFETKTNEETNTEVEKTIEQDIRIVYQVPEGSHVIPSPISFQAMLDALQKLSPFKIIQISHT
jgi:hypothetical protein